MALRRATTSPCSRMCAYNCPLHGSASPNSNTAFGSSVSSARVNSSQPPAMYTTSESIPSGQQPSAAVRSANEPKRNRRGGSETGLAMSSTSFSASADAAYYSKYMAFRPGIWYHAREEGVVVHGTDRRKTQDRHKLPRRDRQRPARRGAPARRQHGQARGRGASGRRDGAAAGGRRHGLVRAAVPLPVFAHAARAAGRQARTGGSAGAGGGA